MLISAFVLYIVKFICIYNINFVKLLLSQLAIK